MSGKRRKVEWSLDLEHMRTRAGQVVSDVMGGTAEVKKAQLREARSGAASAAITIEFSVGHASIAALPADSPDLFQAQISYVGEYEFIVSGREERFIRLQQASDIGQALGAAVHKAKNLRWDIRLAPGIPLKLNLKGSLGKTDVDLSQLLAHNLKLESGLGALRLNLPQQERPLSAEIMGGVGTTAITIPDSAAGDIKIRGAVGNIALQAPRPAALRLQCKRGLGKIKLPEGYLRAPEHERDAGKEIWESPNNPDAQRKIFVDYEGGIGRFSLRNPDSPYCGRKAR